MWLLPISLSLYKRDDIPKCVKNIAITTLVFCILFIILIPIAILLYKKSLKESVIKSICGDVEGNGCIEKIKKMTENMKTCGKLRNEINKKDPKLKYYLAEEIYLTNKLKTPVKDSLEELELTNRLDIVMKNIKPLDQELKNLKSKATELSCA
jgi:hypothetical protein